MTLKREIKDAYIEGGNSIYVKTHSNAIYVDDNETETLTKRLDDIKGKIDNNTSQLETITKIITPSMTVEEINNILSLGGEIKFSSGVYNINKTLICTSNSKIFATDVTLKSDSPSLNLFGVSNCSNVEISGFNVDGNENNSNILNFVKYDGGCSNLTIAKNTLKACFIYGSYNSNKSKNIKIEYNYITGNYGNKNRNNLIQLYGTDLINIDWNIIECTNIYRIGKFGASSNIIQALDSRAIYYIPDNNAKCDFINIFNNTISVSSINEVSQTYGKQLFDFFNACDNINCYDNNIEVTGNIRPESIFESKQWGADSLDTYTNVTKRFKIYNNKVKGLFTNFVKASSIYGINLKDNHGNDYNGNNTLIEINGNIIESDNKAVLCDVMRYEKILIKNNSFIQNVDDSLSANNGVAIRSCGYISLDNNYIDGKLTILIMKQSAVSGSMSSLTLNTDIKNIEIINNKIKSYSTNLFKIYDIVIDDNPYLYINNNLLDNNKDTNAPFNMGSSRFYKIKATNNEYTNTEKYYPNFMSCSRLNPVIDENNSWTTKYYSSMPTGNAFFVVGQKLYNNFETTSDCLGWICTSYTSGTVYEFKQIPLHTS